MTNYKMLKNEQGYCAVFRNEKDSIPLVTENTDYANFKRDIEEGKAELQDADGNLMSAEAAKEFVQTLP